jgi:hypothetical protein
MTTTFEGRDDDDTTYSLDELLGALLDVVTKTAHEYGGMPSAIMPDELSMVEPLQKVLETAFGEVCPEEELETIVRWYPPASKEEQENASRILPPAHHAM